MKKSLSTFREIIEDVSPKHYSIVLAIPVLFLVTGFLVWNIYLYNFGFVEDSLIRGKFILAGIVFYVITTLFFAFLMVIGFSFALIVKLVFNLISGLFGQELKNKILNFLRELFDFETFGNITGACVLFFIWLIIYTVYIFPMIPGVFGGGQPRSVSLVATADTLSILTSLGIQRGEGATYQTANLCIVHENEQGIYVLLGDRVIMLKNSLFEGFSALPGIKSVYEQNCILIAREWSIQGFVFSRLLIQTELQNIWRALKNEPQQYFSVVQQISTTSLEK